MGATRQIKMQFDIMVNDRFFATFRGLVDQHPRMAHDGRCVWQATMEDVYNAAIARYPSLTKKKQFEVYVD